MSNAIKNSFEENNLVSSLKDKDYNHSNSKYSTKGNFFKSLISWSFLIGCFYYIYLFFKGLSPYWFNSEWTTDDAYQQLFPFNEVINPGIFSEDVIYNMMKGYLTPLHYWLSYSITLLTKSPIMTGHWVMLVQVVLTLVPMFLAVYVATSFQENLSLKSSFSSKIKYNLISFIPATFAVAWMLHTRHAMQRLTCGLPRGWAAPIVALCLYCMLAKKHKTILIVLAVGCILHPPSTCIMALAYGLLLIFNTIEEYRNSSSENLKATDHSNKKLLVRYILLSPAYIIATFLAIRMPAEFGSMASLEVARARPEFTNPGGRFPFVPLLPYWTEFKNFSFQAFLNKWYKPGRFIVNSLPIVLIVITLLSLLRTKGNNRKVLGITLLSIITIHFLSRQFAFYLYVPNRHLQIPMPILLITLLTVSIWNSTARKFKGYTVSVFSLAVLTTFIFLTGGSGLVGRANFNTRIDQKGRVAQWLAKNSSKDALIAGHPTIIDGIPLIANRRVLISTEMAHPFYKGYYDKIRDRISVSLKAHYAKDLRELYEIVSPHGVDYFVFERARFYPEALERASYFKPYDVLVKELTSGDKNLYAYRQLPKEMNPNEAPYLVYKDHKTAMVDVSLIGKAIKEGKL